MSELHQHTPALQVIDPRGLAVRKVTYYRASLAQSLQTRVARASYDAAGRLVRQWDPRLGAQAGATANSVTTYSLSGAALRAESVDAGWRTCLLSDAGQPLMGWDGRGSRSRTEYDHLLRPRALFEQGDGEDERCIDRFQYAGVEEESVERNACGRLVRHDDTAGSASWSGFDLHGQPLSETRRFLAELTPPDWPESMDEREALLEEDSYTTQWRRDALGAGLMQIDAFGNVSEQRYTIAGQLADGSLTLSGQTAGQILVHDIVYNAFGQVETQTSGNGVVSSTKYDEASGRLTHLAARRTADQAPLQDLHYSYDPVGNMMQIDDGTVPVQYWRNQRTDGVSTYHYDTWYQLIKATGRESAGAVIGPSLPDAMIPIPTPGGGDDSVLGHYTQSYEYDAGGNLTQLRHNGLHQYTRSMVVAPNSNRSLYQAEGDPVPDFEEGFDANGNQRELQPGQSMRWNVRSQLSTVVMVERDGGANDDEVYAYAGGHQRIRKRHTTKAQGTMHYAEVRYLPGLEWRTNTATGESLQVITAPAGRSSVRVLHWQARSKSNDIPNDQIRYQFDDHLGSATLELDGDANLTSREGYYPYGGTAWFAACSEIEVKYKTIRYAGKERDATGLYYYGFRYYAPWLCRWINTDPAGAVDGLNRYRMVMGNPVTYRDWMGLYSSGEIASAMGAAFVRDATSSLLSSTVKYAAGLSINALVGSVVNVPLTVVGATVGAISGAYVGAGLGAQAGGAAAARWLGNPDNAYATGIGGALGMVAGAGMGAVPSIAGHFVSGDGVNKLAIGQITNALDAGGRDIMQTVLKEAGPSIKWKANVQPPLKGVATTAALQAVARAAIGAATSTLSGDVVSVPVRAAVAGVSQAIGTWVRGYLWEADSSRSAHNEDWAKKQGKLLDISNPAALRTGASSVLQMLEYGIGQIPGMGGLPAAAAAAIKESQGGGSELRSLVANPMAAGIQKLMDGSPSPASSAYPAAMHAAMSDTVAGLESVGIDLHRLNVHADELPPIQLHMGAARTSLASIDSDFGRPSIGKTMLH